MSLRPLLSVSGFLYALATWLAAMIDGALFFVLIATVEIDWFPRAGFLREVYWLDGILAGAVVGLGIQIVHESYRGMRQRVAAIRKNHAALVSLRVQHAAPEGDCVPPVSPPPPDRLIGEVYGMWWINLGIQMTVIAIVLRRLTAAGIRSTPDSGFLQSLHLYALPPNLTLLDTEWYAFWFFVVTGGIVAPAALISVPMTVIIGRPLRNRIRDMDQEIDGLRRSLSHRAGLGTEELIQQR
jgi:hypothetical protein